MSERESIGILKSKLMEYIRHTHYYNQKLEQEIKEVENTRNVLNGYRDRIRDLEEALEELK